MRNSRIVDIAKKAGVSPSAVSFVLSGKARQYRISEKLQRHILTIAKELGYEPNLLARSLRSKSTDIIGFVGLGKNDPYGYMFLEAIVNEAEQLGYSTFIGYSRRDPKLMEKRFKQLLNWKVTGIIFEWVFGFEKTSIYKNLLKQSELPLVAIRSRIPASKLIHVGFDVETILKTILTRVFDLGHRNVLLLDTDYQLYDRNAREKVLREELEKIGEPFNNNLIFVAQDQKTVAELLTPLLKNNKHQRPTVILSYSFTRAAGAYVAATECNLKIPEDLSIVVVTGYRQTPFQKVQFEQFQYDHHALGKSAFDILEQLIRGEYKGGKKMVEHVGQWIKGSTLGAVPDH